MANYGDTVTSAAQFFKYYYRNHAEKDMQLASELFALFMQRAKSITAGGRDRNATWEFQRNTGVGASALSEGGAYAEPVPSKAVNPALAIVDWSFSSEWTGNVLSMGSSSTARFEPGKWSVGKVREMMDFIKKFVARMAMWDGTANLCQATNVSAGALGYFEILSGACSIQMFEAGMRVTARDASSGGTEQLTNQSTGGGIIVDVDPALGRVYLNDSTGLANNDYIAYYGFYDTTVINGIRNLVSNTGTVQGINRGTGSNAYWRSVVVDNGGDPLGPSAVDLIRDSIKKQNYGRDQGQLVWAGNMKTRRWAALSVVGQVRFASITDLTLGTPKLEIGTGDGTASFVENEFFLDSEIFCFDPTAFVKAFPEGMEGPQLVEWGGSPILPVMDSNGRLTDKQQISATWRGNFGIDRARCMGKLNNFVSP